MTTVDELDAQATIEELRTKFVALGEALWAFWESLAPVLTDLYTAVYNVYLEAGASHGDSHEGLVQWLAEEGARRRAEWEAEQAAQRDWMVEDFRRQIAEKRGAG